MGGRVDGGWGVCRWFLDKGLGGWIGALDEFDFVAFGGVNKGEEGAGGLALGGAVGEGDAFGGEVFAEFGEVFDFEGEVGEVGLDVDGAGAGEVGDFEEFFGAGGAEEGELGAAGGGVAFDEFEAEDVGVEVEGAFEVVNAVAGVEEFGDFHGEGGRSFLVLSVLVPSFSVEGVILLESVP